MSQMSAIVSLACKNLSDDEVLALNLAAQLGTDPRGVLGYDKVNYLFTEQNGTRMHAETKDALAAVIVQRFGL